MTSLDRLLPWTVPPTDDPDAITEAVAETEARVTAELRPKLARLAVEDAAKGRLIDPADAGRLIDLDDLDPDDTEAITTAIDTLIAERPYLAPPPPQIESGADWLKAGWASTRSWPHRTGFTRE